MSKPKHPGAKTRVRRPREWQLQEAKARFSELFRLAQETGPQRVTKHGRSSVIVIDSDEYERLCRSKHKDDLVEFFAKSPLADPEVVFERDKDYGRDVEL